MHQRDYILRLIEQLGVAFAAIRKRILRREKSDDVRGALAQTAGQAGFDIELLKRFDLDTLRLFAMPTGEVEPTRCWLMAEILYLDGLEASLSAEAAGESLLKARALFDLVRPAGGLLVGWPEAAARIVEIDRLLEGASDLESNDGDVRSRRVSTRVLAMRADHSDRCPSQAAPSQPWRSDTSVGNRHRWVETPDTSARRSP